MISGSNFIEIDDNMSELLGKSRYQTFNKTNLNLEKTLKKSFLENQKNPITPRANISHHSENNLEL